MLKISGNVGVLGVVIGGDNVEDELELEKFPAFSFDSWAIAPGNAIPQKRNRITNTAITKIPK
jgi:hypothetical protein